jgi:hypothetical protein
MRDTRVTGNRLIATDPTGIQGAGPFTTVPVTLIESRIVRNTPDQCVGCDQLNAALRGASTGLVAQSTTAPTLPTPRTIRHARNAPALGAFHRTG